MLLAMFKAILTFYPSHCYLSAAKQKRPAEYDSKKNIPNCTKFVQYCLVNATVKQFIQQLRAQNLPTLNLNDFVRLSVVDLTLTMKRH